MSGLSTVTRTTWKCVYVCVCTRARARVCVCVGGGGGGVGDGSSYNKNTVDGKSIYIGNHDKTLKMS